jgi:hypothetical protein
MGVKALDFAEKFQYLPGRGYRDAGILHHGGTALRS